MVALIGAALVLGAMVDHRDAPTPLQAALQGVLDKLSGLHPSFKLQLGWTFPNGSSFGLSAGGATPHDKFLFGSGTKPITAVAVLRLVDAGKVNLDDSVASHVDSVLSAANGTNMTSLFGIEARDVTVRQLLFMQSGLPDFDTPTLDDRILQDKTADWPPYAIIRAAASGCVDKTKPCLHFAPGTHTEYSSTNFVLAGLVLLAHSPAAKGDWRRLDLFSLTFPPELHAKYAGVKFLADEPISSMATVKGVSGMIKGHKTEIWEQRGGVLGWTCGNMVASTKDVSAFYHDLLVAKKILKNSTLQTMQDFRLLDYGWARGGIYYGGGLMIEQAIYHGTRIPPHFEDWGAYLGHGGDTYGFLSEQGIVGRLDNASFSLVSNQDYDGSFVTHAMACRTIVAAAKALKGEAVTLACGS